MRPTPQPRCLSATNICRVSFCGFDINLPLTGLRLHAFDGMNSGIQFRRIDNCGVGDQTVIDMGFLDAVDVWSNVGSGFSVCFPQPGHIVFLDAATSPRALTEVENVIDDGYACAAMDRAGAMVLVSASAGAAAQPSTAAAKATYSRRPGTDDSIRDAVALEGCAATPTVNLRLRAAPWGKILDVVPSGAVVTVHARTKSWYFVADPGNQGWIAAWLARSNGDCPWIGGLSDIATRRYRLASNS